MEPYTLSRKQKTLYRGDRHLRALEREQLKTVREVAGALDNAKQRLEKRLDWLKGLEEALIAEEDSLKRLQTEFENLLDEAIHQAMQAKIRVEEEHQTVEQELQQMKEQTDTFIEEERHHPIAEKLQDIKVFVRPFSEETPEETPESQVRVQWYHPGQNGFSL